MAKRDRQRLVRLLPYLGRDRKRLLTRPTFEGSSCENSGTRETMPQLTTNSRR